MKWNWQQPDWPHFTWDRNRFALAEQQFLLSGGVLLGTVKHLGEEERNQLTVEAMSTEALTTSEIEGEILDRASVQSSIQKQLGLVADNRRVAPREQGVAEMMVDSLPHLLSSPLRRNDIRMAPDVDERQEGHRGCWPLSYQRSSPCKSSPAQLGAPKIHFEAPPSTQVPGDMAGFIDWFQRTAPGGTEPLPALTRAGIAHLYFESIHPFEDGNGRIGRAIAEKSLAQSLGQPTLIVLAATILARRASYYKALEAASKQNEITGWLAWFAGIAIEAQRRTLALIEFLHRQSETI